MPTNTLKKIPIDIFEQILEQLPVHDVVQLRKAISGCTERTALDLECVRRISVTRYLNDWFGDGEKLLNVMDTNRAYIWGPASLDFFTGSNTVNMYSWCFISPYNDSGDQLYNTLHDMGVAWLSYREQVARLAQLRQRFVVVSVNVLRSERLVTEEILARHNKTLSFNDNWNSSIRLQLTVNNNVVTALPYTDAGDLVSAATSSSNVTHGYIRHRGSEVGVSLYRTVFYPTDVIKHTRLSCMQTVITSRIALHMHGKLASQRNTYDWGFTGSRILSNTPGDQSLVESRAQLLLQERNSIKDHGISVIPYYKTGSGTTARYCSDDLSTLIVYSHSRNSDICTRLANLRWLDTTHGITSVLCESPRDGCS